MKCKYLPVASDSCLDGTVLELKNKYWVMVRGGEVEDKSEQQNERGMNAIQSHGVKMA